jgi:hypothetical protein
LAEPAFARGLLPGLLVMALWRQEVGRREGEHWGVSRPHSHRRKRRVIIPRLPMGALSRAAIGAPERCGRTIRGAIKGDEPLLIEPPQRRQQGGLMQLRTDRQKDGVAMAWCHPLTEGPDVMVPGDVPHADQGLGVSVSVAVVPPTLVRQKRRRWGEKETTGASGGVLDRVRGIGAGLAQVGQLSRMLTQHRLEMIGAEGRHRGLRVAKESPTLSQVCVSSQLSELQHS